MSDDGPRARWCDLMLQITPPAFGMDEYVGQESTVTAGEMRRVARAAGITGRSVVADLCCGVAGPGRLIVRDTGCRLVGVDRSSEAVSIATRLAAAERWSRRAAFVVGDATATPLKSGFDAVLLLESLLSIADKCALVREIGRLLRNGGRVALTLEEGTPLTSEERQSIPEGDSIWIIEEAALVALLAHAGLRVIWRSEITAGHALINQRLSATFREQQMAILPRMGAPFWSRTVAQHERLAEWMMCGRLRKLAIVAERRD